MRYTEEDLRVAFYLGFESTEEGFNGECAFENCAPLIEDVRERAGMSGLRWLRKVPEYVALEDEAMKMISSGLPDDD